LRKITLTVLFFILSFFNTSSASTDTLISSLKNFTDEIEKEYSKIGVVINVKEVTYIPSSLTLAAIDSLLSQTGKNFLTISKTAEYIYDLNLKPSQIEDSIPIEKFDKYGIDAFILISINNFNLNHFTFKLLDVNKGSFIAESKTYEEQPTKLTGHSGYSIKEIDTDRNYQKLYVTLYGGMFVPIFIGMHYGTELIFLPSENLALSLNYQRGYFTDWWETYYYHKIGGRVYLATTGEGLGIPTTTFLGLGLSHIPFKYKKNDRKNHSYLGTDILFEMFWEINHLKLMYNIDLCFATFATDSTSKNTILSSGFNFGIGF
jgi:hypothetical protein